MERTASAVWNGGMKDGKGTLSAASGALKETPYSFAMRFESSPGTNPEELIGAAHAGCFAMALAGQLERAGMKAERIQTNATVTLEMGTGGPAITAVHLDVTAKVPGATQEAFSKAANETKTGCPVSKVLNTNITMDARLET
ncbi:MAG TPA: OsmC family protein [Burkholderiales bacterium]